MSSNQHQSQAMDGGHNNQGGNNYQDPNDAGSNGNQGGSGTVTPVTGGSTGTTGTTGNEVGGEGGQSTTPGTIVSTGTTGTTGTAPTVITATNGETVETGEGSGSIVNATGGATIVAVGSTTGGTGTTGTTTTTPNTYNIESGENTLTGVNLGSDDIHVASGATGVINLASTTANLSTSTTTNSGTIIVNVEPATTSTITGASSGTSIINGGTGAVTVHESAGNDVINGGTGGINTVVYTDVTSSSLAVSSTTGTTTVQKASVGGTDTLSNVQRIHFTDTNVALDINGNAGTAAKILGTVLGSTAVSVSNPLSPLYEGVILGLLDNGASESTVLNAAFNAVGATTNTAVVNTLWTNLFGAAPTAAQAAPIVALLNNGSITASALETMVAESSTLAQNINLVGLQSTGIHYI